MKETIYILDGHSYIYRAFFAVKGLTNDKGLPTNAIYGFTKMLLKIITKKKPKYILACFDSPGPIKRTEELLEYKANREPMPEDLSVQIPFILKIVESLNIPISMQEGVEADDLIASYSKLATEQDLDVVIVSGDKDLMQMVDDEKGVVMWDTMKDVIYDRKGVKAKMGVYPESIPDFLGLAGDASDNIPGIKGIGPKTAVTMLEQCHHLEKIYENLDSLATGKTLEKFQEGKEMAFLSRMLATINTTLALPHTHVSELTLKEPNYEELYKIFADLGFSKNTFSEAGNGFMGITTDSTSSENIIQENNLKSNFLIVSNDNEFDELYSALEKSNEIAFDTETDSVKPIEANLVGLAISVGETSWYLPYPSKISKDNWDKLLVLLSTKNLIAHNAKFDIHVLRSLSQSFYGRLKVFDTSVAAYLLDPENRRYGLKDVSTQYLGAPNHNVKNYDEVVGDQDIKTVEPEVLRDYACEDARSSFELKKILEPKLTEQGLDSISADIEFPLVNVLCDIEEAGVLIDTIKLKEQEVRLTATLKELEKKIYELAGEEFNISSPTQLQKILFEKLELSTGRKTKTGFSTDEKVLKDLSSSHPLPKLLLEYRHIAKLLSTYIEALPLQINKNTGRIHTNFSQIIASTGRLSSSNPNLQNIPIKSEYGSQIREAFIPKPGFIMASLDYSQIELRILAHETQEHTLIDAFNNGKDIHTKTASIIMDKPESEVTKEERRIAKTINFGLMYGMGPFKLAGELGISRSEAKTFIDKYFSSLQRVKSWKEEYLQKVYENGFAETLFGRKRWFSGIRSNNRIIEEAAKREATNFVFQGTNADIIKVAMIRVSDYISENKLEMKMILQVHDELVFELPKSEEGHLQEIKTIMESVIKLDVPIIVEIGVGDSWLGAH